jgi:hypothetical protein
VRVTTEFPAPAPTAALKVTAVVALAATLNGEAGETVTPFGKPLIATETLPPNWLRGTTLRLTAWLVPGFKATALLFNPSRKSGMDAA